MARTRKPRVRRTGGARRAATRPRPQIQSQTVVVKYPTGKGISYTDRIPAITMSHGMHPDPDRDLNVLASRMDTLTSNQLRLFAKYHQDEINKVYRMRIDPTDLAVSTNNPQDRAASIALAGMSQPDGTNQSIQLPSQPPTPTAPSRSTSSVTPIQDHFATDGSFTSDPGNRNAKEVGTQYAPDLEIRSSPASWKKSMDSRGRHYPEEDTNFNPKGMGYVPWQKALSAGNASRMSDPRPQSGKVDSATSANRRFQ